MECCGIILKTLAVRPVPTLDGRGRPLRRFVRMAIVASVGSAELHRQVRSRYPQTVIVPQIDDHVATRRHMTRRAADGRFNGFMMVVSGDGIFVRGVTLQTDAVTGRFQ